MSVFAGEALFIDRCDAGRRLAKPLLRFKDQRPIVLALPRGGVPVGFEVARALEATLDLVLGRKIGAPFQPELAVGAVVDGPHPGKNPGIADGSAGDGDTVHTGLGDHPQAVVG